jgi:hypothetical protein
MSLTKKPSSAHGLIMGRDFPSWTRQLGLWLVVLCGAAAGIDLAKGGTANTSVVYELNGDSSFMQGCFPPCACPVMLGTPVKATFLLTPTGFDGLYDTYAVTNASWLFQVNGTNLYATGSGTYKVGGEVAVEQELTLDLVMGGGLPAHFDSGLVPDSMPFPNIKLSVSTASQVCFDKVFNVSASPVAPPQVHLTFASTNNIVLSWPVSAVPYVLQETSDLSASNWNTLTNVPTLLGQQYQIVLARPSDNTFYRLQPTGN